MIKRITILTALSITVIICSSSYGGLFTYFKNLELKKKAYNEALKMKINEVDMSLLDNKQYVGYFIIYTDTVSVHVELKDKAVSEIKLVKYEDSKYYKKAKEIIPKIIDKQKLSVDAVSGATISCQVIKKAVENALTSQ